MPPSPPHPLKHTVLLSMHLIWQKPVSNVGVAQLHCCLKSFLIIAAVVVALVALSQPLEDLQRLSLTRLQHVHRLEAPAATHRRHSTATQIGKYVEHRFDLLCLEGGKRICSVLISVGCRTHELESPAAAHSMALHSTSMTGVMHEGMWCCGRWHCPFTVHTTKFTVHTTKCSGCCRFIAPNTNWKLCWPLTSPGLGPSQYASCARPMWSHQCTAAPRGQGQASSSLRCPGRRHHPHYDPQHQPPPRCGSHQSCEQQETGQETGNKEGCQCIGFEMARPTPPPPPRPTAPAHIQCVDLINPTNKRQCTGR